MPAKEPGFAERLQAAAKAKQAQLEKMRITKQVTNAKPAEPQAAATEAGKVNKPRTAKRKDAKPVTAKLVASKPAIAKPKQADNVAGEKARKEAEVLARAQAEAKAKQEKAAREARYPAHKARRK